jgi:hypothetical protein
LFDAAAGCRAGDRGAATAPKVGSQPVMTKAGLVYERDIVHAGTPHLLFRIRRP